MVLGIQFDVKKNRLNSISLRFGYFFFFFFFFFWHRLTRLMILNVGNSSKQYEICPSHDGSSSCGGWFKGKFFIIFLTIIVFLKLVHFE